MKRMIKVLMVAVLMAVILVASISPALAARSPRRRVDVVDPALPRDRPGCTRGGPGPQPTRSGPGVLVSVAAWCRQ